MFGESESESPRVPSPWDSLIELHAKLSTSSSSGSSRERKVAKRKLFELVPEAEEGNVEYKLQLLKPSPARFTRLVTQLKWRLLEGGGQAYYELGVADSGALVGLPRLELEQSLETLEMMAGEIGATVIIVKEVEVVPCLANLIAPGVKLHHNMVRYTQEQEVRTDGASGRDFSFLLADRESSVAFPEVYRVDTTNVDLQDSSNSSSPDVTIPVHVNFRDLQPSAARNTPFRILTVPAETVCNECTDIPPGTKHPIPQESLALEISVLYKPKAMERHIPTFSAGSSLGQPVAKVDQQRTTGKAQGCMVQKKTCLVPYTKQQMKVQYCRPARYHRGEAQRTMSLISEAIAADHTLVPALDSLHVDVETPHDPDATALCPSKRSLPIPDVVSEIDVDDLEKISKCAIAATSQPRFIVEALIEQKQSLERAFLDFAGFS